MDAVLLRDQGDRAAAVCFGISAGGLIGAVLSRPHQPDAEPSQLPTPRQSHRPSGPDDPGSGSVGQQASPDPSRDLVLWRVRKAGQTAHAVVRLRDTGRELRVYVGSHVHWSQSFRDDEDARVIAQIAAHHLAELVRLGWARG